MCLNLLKPPTYPPKAAPVCKPGVSEPMPPLTGTLLRKPPPPEPPNSHCCAKLAAAAAVRTRIERRSVFMFNLPWLLHNPYIERSGTAALCDDEGYGQTERHRSRHRGIDLIESDGAGHKARVLHVETDAAQQDAGLNHGVGQRVGGRGHAGIDSRRGASQAGGPDDDGVAGVHRIGGSNQLAVVGAGNGGKAGLRSGGAAAEDAGRGGQDREIKVVTDAARSAQGHLGVAIDVEGQLSVDLLAAHKEDGDGDAIDGEAAFGEGGGQRNFLSGRSEEHTSELQSRHYLV